MTIYFLGGGNMATAIAQGLIKQGNHNIHIANRSVEKREKLARTLGVTVSETLPALTKNDVLILAVKPQDMKAACAPIQTNGALILSVAAGLSIDTLSRYLGGTRRIIRTMPNTPSQIGLGISGLFAEDDITESDKQQAEQIMQAVGQTVWLQTENDIHAITGISGSGPAYIFYLMNALSAAAEQQGFTPNAAKQLTLATFKGAVMLAEQSGEPFSTLQQQVTSKGGTTYAALQSFEQNRLAETIRQGVEACVQRSQALADEYSQNP